MRGMFKLFGGILMAGLFLAGQAFAADQLCSSSQHSRIGFRRASWFWQGAWRYIDTPDAGWKCACDSRFPQWRNARPDGSHGSGYSQ